MRTEENLNRAFAALANPTRRAVVTRLGGSEALSVSDLASPFNMSLPAVMKHIRVLEGAGLVVREKNGRTVYCRLNPGPMVDAIDWLKRTRSFWQSRLDALADFVEADDSAQRPSPRTPKEACK